MKNIFWGIIFLILFFSCSRNIVSNDGFVHYLQENKQNISIFLVNQEATSEFNKIFYKYNENIFDENGALIESYIISNDNKLLGYYKINNNWKETFFGYIILQNNEINIGKYISKIITKKLETGILVTCILDSDGDIIFNEFTTNNINKNIAIVFNNKIIIFAIIAKPLNNSINFEIGY